jgi:hypothetical protein
MSDASIIQPAPPGKILEAGTPPSTKLLLHKRRPGLYTFFRAGDAPGRRRLKKDTDKGHPARKPRSAKPLT